ncbi:hypothetical protein HN51_011452 [Arachis hypogaea]
MNVGYVKHKLDALDAENFVYHDSIIEGTVLPENLEKISNEYKLVPSADGGCIIKSINKYYTKGDEQLTEEFLNVGKEKSAAFTKAVEAYLLYSLAVRRKGSGRNTMATQREKESARTEDTANELPNDGEGASNHGDTAFYDGDGSSTVAVEAVSV